MHMYQNNSEFETFDIFCNAAIYCRPSKVIVKYFTNVNQTRICYFRTRRSLTRMTTLQEPELNRTYSNLGVEQNRTPAMTLCLCLHVSDCVKDHNLTMNKNEQGSVRYFTCHVCMWLHIWSDWPFRPLSPEYVKHAKEILQQEQTTRLLNLRDASNYQMCTKLSKLCHAGHVTSMANRPKRMNDCSYALQINILL